VIAKRMMIGAAGVGLVAAVLAGGPARASSGPATGATCGRWMDAHQSPAARAHELLGAMTTTEKLAMVHQTVADLAWFGAAGYVAPIPSLCIPALTLNDAGSGLGDGQLGVTAYPAAIAQAASWDPSLQYQLGRSLGAESVAKGINVLLAPDVNIARVPLNGRTSEALGEDPYLSGQTAAAYIQGVQSEHVIATVKHYAANNQETNRMSVNELVTDRALHEIYEPAFDAAVTQGHAGSVMCSYNRVNGAYACQNPTLIHTQLERQYGFTGFVMSDWGATHSTVPSALAGLDMEMDVIQTPDALAPVIPDNPGAEDYYGAPLAAAVASGQVPMAVLDGMVGRILGSMFAVGLFDHPVAPQPAASAAVADTAANRQVALQGAEAGTVLLRNQGQVLPFTGADRTIAVIGADATTPGALTVDQAGGSVHVNQPLLVSPLEAIAARAARSGAAVVYNDGSSPVAAATLARHADVAVVFAGYSEAEGADQPNLGFNQGLACSLSCVSTSSDSDQLIAAVAAANTRTVVVLDTGGPVLMPWVDRVAGIVEGWYPGEEDGTAAAAVLFGDVDPAGKLPITFPRSQADLPTRTAAQYPGVGGVATYSEGLDVGYRWYQAQGIAPLFPFGFGLSYTTFALSGMTVTPTTGDGWVVTATVTNTGHRQGADVVQLYVGDPPSTAEPPNQLKAYQKVSLRPGQQTTVTLPVPEHALAIWDSAHQRWAVTSGCYRLSVGDSSAHLPLHADVGQGGATCP